jgi:hypothetical protein
MGELLLALLGGASLPSIERIAGERSARDSVRPRPLFFSRAASFSEAGGAESSSFRLLGTEDAENSQFIAQPFFIAPNVIDLRKMY